MLDLSPIINIIVNMPAQSSQAENFSLALFLSKNTIISTAERVKTFGSTNELIAAGFAENSPEVKAADLYFGQTPTPAKLMVGVQGANESPVAALTACRAADTSWYICVPIGATKDDIIAMAAFVESAKPSTLMFCTTADNDVFTGAAGNLCAKLQNSKYSRTLVQYSAYPNAAASIAGYACAENDSSEAFDLALKSEPGVSTDDLTSTDVSVLQNENCNYYANYENQYDLFMPGNMIDGTPCDEIMGIDILTANIKAAVMSVLVSRKKIPLSDDGIALATSAIAIECDKAKSAQFIKPGVWNGGTVLQLKNGDSLVNGYSIQADSVENLSETQKSQRKAPPIYVCLILADSARSFTITANVIK